MKRIIKDPTYSVYSKGGNVVNKNKEIDKKQLADLEKLQFDLERDIIDTIREDFEKQDKYDNFLDFLKSKDDLYFKRIELKEGGKVYFLSDYMKLKEPSNDGQQNDWDTWCPGVQIGETINSPLNPVLY